VLQVSAVRGEHSMLFACVSAGCRRGLPSDATFHFGYVLSSESGAFERDDPNVDVPALVSAPV
jgi:hypothetical protein